MYTKLIDQLEDHSDAAPIARTTRAVSRRRPRVMIVMPLSVQLGGGEQMLLDLIEHGRDLDIEWLVTFLSEGPMISRVRDWGVPTFVVPSGRIRQPHRLAATIWKLRGLMRSEHADAVISWIARAHLYGGSAAALAGIPAVWYQLGLPITPSVQERLATALPARGILTCSKIAAQAQQKLWPHRPVRVVHPGVTLKRFNPDSLPTPEECRRNLALPTDGPIIGIVGRLQQWKGMHHLIDAMPQILRSHPDAHCVIVGGRHDLEPDYLNRLEQRVQSKGLAGKVIFAGLQQNIPHWMQAMDVVVHASENEPFGIVVIEAMALGKPVAASDSGGPTEIITHKTSGWLWSSGDPTSLADALLKLLADPELSAGIGKAARRAADRFSSRNYARHVVENVLELIYSPSSQPQLDVPD